MNNFTLQVDAQGVALITLDVAGKSMNIITDDVQREFDEVLAALADDDAIRGAVIVSGKRSGFCPGADLIEMLASIGRWTTARSQEELRQGLHESSGWSRRLRALEACGKPVAAVIAGLAMGGGLELALACHYRVAIDDPALCLALPEAGVGLLPGAGGTQRLARLMGVSAALPYLLDGALINPQVALECGIVHALLPVGDLLGEARRWVLANPQGRAPWDEKGFTLPGGGSQGTDGYRNFGPAMAGRLADDGLHYPSVVNILKAVYEGTQVPIDAALRIESRYFFNTVRTPQAKAMARTFFVSRQALARRTERTDMTPLLGALQTAVSVQSTALLAEGFTALLVAEVGRLTAVHVTEQSACTPANGEPDLAPEVLTRMRQRFLYAQAVTAARYLDQGRGDPLEIDASALKAGFPAWTGGPLSFVEVTGVPRFLETLDELATAHGQQFTLPTELRERLTACGTLYT